MFPWFIPVLRSLQVCCPISSGSRGTVTRSYRHRPIKFLQLSSNKWGVYWEDGLFGPHPYLPHTRRHGIAVACAWNESPVRNRDLAARGRGAATHQRCAARGVGPPSGAARAAHTVSAGAGRQIKACKTRVLYASGRQIQPHCACHIGSQCRLRTPSASETL